MLNIENLKKLRDRLIEHKDIIEPSFTMKSFREGRPPKILGDEVMTPENACGSVGCVVGWMPFLGEESFKVKGVDLYDDTNLIPNISHLNYSSRILFDSEGYSLISQKEDILWDFLFSSHWAHISSPFDNLESAIERIGIVIEHGYDYASVDDPQVAYFLENIV